MQRVDEFGGESARGQTKGGAVDVPQTAETVQHRDDVIVGEGVKEGKVRLEVILGEDDADGAAPGEEAKSPGDPP